MHNKKALLLFMLLPMVLSACSITTRNYGDCDYFAKPFYITYSLLSSDGKTTPECTEARIVNENKWALFGASDAERLLNIYLGYDGDYFFPETGFYNEKEPWYLFDEFYAYCHQFVKNVERSISSPWDYLIGTNILNFSIPAYSTALFLNPKYNGVPYRYMTTSYIEEECDLVDKINCKLFDEPICASVPTCLYNDTLTFVGWEPFKYDVSSISSYSEEVYHSNNSFAIGYTYYVANFQ